MAKKLSFIDFNEYYEEDKIITVADGYKNKDKEFDPDGIYSERIFGDYYAEDNDITQRGWIKLNYPLMNPIYHIMAKKKKLITDEDCLMDVIKQLKEDPSSFLEPRRNAKTSQIIDFLYENLKYAIIDVFPVFSHKLRPITVIQGAKPTLIYDKINNYFSLLIEYNNTIGEYMTDKNYDNGDFIDAMQDKVDTIAQFIISNMLSRKPGILRKEVLGMRVNFSARAVITPLVGNYEIDDVALPYRVAVEIYKYQIINLLTKIKGINYNEALRIHEMAELHFDKEVYSIMQSLLKNTVGGLKVLINRNPTISIGSIMYLNVAKIKADYDDVTLSISNNVLSPFAGDYDGDVLNIIALFDNMAKESFKILSPRNLIISSQGELDRRFSFIKEQNLGIWQLNNSI